MHVTEKVFSFELELYFKQSGNVLLFQMFCYITPVPKPFQLYSTPYHFHIMLQGHEAICLAKEFETKSSTLKILKILHYTILYIFIYTCLALFNHFKCFTV